MPSSDEKSDEKAPEQSPTTIFFDPQGDTRLLGAVDGVDKIFVVSAKSMMLACDAWNRMLAPDGHFKEAQPTADGMKEVELPDDDGKALTILLDIAHLRFHKVPKTLSFSDLLQVAVLTDKYGATRLVEPWVKRWLEDAKGTINAPGHQEWLWIAWEFGEIDIFKKVSSHLVKKVKLNKDQTYSNLNGFLPPGIAESIIKIRGQVIQAILDLCYKHVDKYKGPPNWLPRYPHKVCKQTTNTAACDAMMYGSFLLNLHKIGFDETRETLETAFCNIDYLGRNLRSINLPQYVHDSYSRASSHYNPHRSCNFQDEFKYSLETILDDIPSAVLQPHGIHMERQRAILQGVDAPLKN